MIESKKSVGGRRTRERTRGELRVRIEPVRVATPVYKRPGVNGSSGAMSDFIRPVRERSKVNIHGEARIKKNERRTFDLLFDGDPT